MMEIPIISGFVENYDPEDLDVFEGEPLDEGEAF